ncbi:MAG: TIR domain-containing protein [Clostridiaceae bacterium]|jgi:hypothetical protein|nr:TIR domain-containing protein [Clostridiaceae bacterium]
MNNSMGQEYLYDVFLSYRHKPLDSRICKKLHTLLETYKPARRFRHGRTGRVFRDDEELPAAGILSDSIARALVSAKCLVVICSPHTPESEWVDREVRTMTRPWAITGKECPWERSCQSGIPMPE